MSIFVNNTELENIISAQKESQIGKLRDEIFERAYESISEPRIMHSSDTEGWWYLAPERLGDTSFCYAVHKFAGRADEKQISELGAWIHDRTLEICRKDVDEWVGPWFRKRSKPLCGMLETSHVTKAVCEVYDLCPDLFDAEEKREILAAIRVKGLTLLEEFLRVGHFNNWYCVISSGIATAAVILGEREICERAIGLYNKCCTLYDSDGYGETLSYADYASSVMLQIREVLIRYDESFAEKLPLTAVAGTVKWTVSSLLYMKPLGKKAGDAVYPRSANFGDCASVFRPTGNMILQIAADYKDETIAGLARWLFDTTYAESLPAPYEQSDFGFYNSFRYQSILYLLRAKEAVSPSKAGMPLKNIYATGNAMLRDKWENPETILAVQCGYEEHNVDSHRHFDQNSFILAHKYERFFADPGHCCYRLETSKISTKSEHHNVLDFEDENGTKHSQERMKAHAKPLNNLVKYEAPEGWEIIASDCHAAYGPHFSRCERVFACAFPNVMFIIDRIEADIPVKMTSHFILNNRDGGLNTNIADDTRLVFRRGDAGIKFFTFAPGNEPPKLSKRYGYIHTNYHPEPNHIGQGREGSAMIYDYTTENFAKSHIAVYAIAMDGTETVRGWHIKPSGENSYRITSPQNLKAYNLEICSDKADWFKLST